MKNPLPNSLGSYRLNRTLHGRSVHRPKDVPGHNVVRGWSRPGTSDALDLFCTAGTPVYAMHAGHITRIADPDGRLSCIYIDSLHNVTVYAHIKLKWWVRLKKSVRAGQCIGYVGRKLADPHLHMEAEVAGVTLYGKTPRALRDRFIEQIG